MIDYPIKDWFPTEEGQNLANNIVEYISNEVPERHIDECIISIVENICLAINIKKSKRKENPASCIVIAKIKQKILEEQKQQKFITELNDEE